MLYFAGRVFVKNAVTFISSLLKSAQVEPPPRRSLIVSAYDEIYGRRLLTEVEKFDAFLTFFISAVDTPDKRSIDGFIEAGPKEKPTNEIKFPVNWIGNAIRNLQAKQTDVIPRGVGGGRVIVRPVKNPPIDLRN